MSRVDCRRSPARRRTFRPEVLEPRCVLDSTVVLNELMYNPAGAGEELEWVELHNQMSVNIELTGWRLADGIAFDFPDNTILPGGGFLVIAHSPAALAAAGIFTGGLGPWTGSLSNAGEKVELLDNNDRVMDEIEYGDDGEWPVGADGSGASLAKTNRDTATGDPRNWTASKMLGGTPGRDNDALPQTTLLVIDSNWKYDDTGADLGTAWRDSTFDDQAWPSGNGLFYHEPDPLTGPKNTPLTPGRNTYYFRTAFNFAGDPAGVTLKLDATIDDGAIVYLNGQEVYRQNMPAGPVTFATNAQVSIEAAASGPILIPATGFVNGQNVLAVEIHQAIETAPTTLAYYRFEEISGTNIVNSTNNIIHGVMVNSGGLPTRSAQIPSATIPQTGVANTQSLDFNSGGYVRFTGIAQKFIFNANSGAAGDATLEWYLKTAGSPHSAMFWSNGDTTADGNRYNVYWNSSWLPGPPPNSERFIAGDGQPTGVIGQHNNGNPLTLGDWHHVAVVRTDNTPANTTDTNFTWRWYIDGALSDGHTATTTGGLPTASQWLLAGRQGSHAFNGWIDEVRFTRGALASGQFLNSPPVPPESGDIVFGAGLSVESSAAPPPPVALNEVAGASDGVFQVELFNHGSQNIDLGGYVLVNTTGQGIEYVFSSQTLAPGGYATVTQAQIGAAADTEKLFLYTPGEGRLLDAIVVKPTARGRTLAGDGSWFYTDQPTFGAANSFEFHDEIVINEIMYRPRGLPATPAVTQNTTLATIDGAWKYDDSGTDFGTPWRDALYDDNAWLSGNGLFYFEDAPLPAPKNTALTPDRSTYYFRKRFTFPGNPANTLLKLRPIVDDGAVYYINGVEVYRQNIPAGPVTYSTAAAPAVGNANLTGPITIAASSLVSGENVLAVEVHQAPSETLAYYRFEEGGASGREVIDSLSGQDHGDLVGMAGLSTDVPSATVPQAGQPNTHSYSSTALGAGFGYALLNPNGAGVPFLFDNPTGDATLEWYMKVPVAQPHSSIFWTDVDNTGALGFNIFWNASFTGAANSDRFIAGGLESDVQIIGTYNNGNPLALNTWHHVAIVRTDLGGGSLQWRWYINGLHSPGHDRTTTGASWPSLVTWSITGRPGFALAALIDEVRLTAAALAPSELLGAPSAGGGPGSTDVVFGAELVATETTSPATPFRESPEEWIELYNRSASPVDISGWRLDEGIDYAFPANTTIGAGSYLVVANDKSYLQSLYPALTILGDYGGSLSNKADWIVLKDARGNPADEVRYYDDKPWPIYADGGGSSLELRDPDADNSRAEAWANSIESTDVPWQSYSYRGIAGPNHSGTTYHELVLGLLDKGEVLLDDVTVTELPGTPQARQLIQQSTFESGIDRWRVLGNHQGSVVVDPDNAANHALRLVAHGATEDRHNHVETTLKSGATFVPITPGREYEIAFRAKWLAGSNQLHTRLFFNRLPRTTLLTVPPLSGTPGARNSVLGAATEIAANIGPTYHNLRHEPVTPAASQPVTVSAVAADPDGVGTMTLRYSVNGGAFANVSMTHQGGGLYAGTIPGQAASAIVQFYVEGVDAHATTPATSTYPAGGASSRALYKVNDGQGQPGGAHDFRILMTPADAAAQLVNSNVMSNLRLGATVIYKDGEVYYDVGSRLKGAPSSRPGGGAGYNVKFNADQLFRGVHETVTIDRNNVSEIFVKHLNNHAGDIPGMYNDLIYVIAPHSGRNGVAQIRMAGFGDVYLESQFQNGGDGTSYEKELTYMPSTTTGGPEGFKIPQPYEHPVELNTDIADYGDDKEAYRFHWLIEDHRDADDFSRIIDLNKAFSLSGAALDAATKNVIDVDQWLRSFAMVRIIGNRDYYTQPGGAPGSWNHNFVAYVRPEDNRVLALPWDIDESFQEPINGSIIGSQNFAKVIQLPGNLRRYYCEYHDLITRTFTASYMSPWAAHFASLAPGVDFSGPVSYIVSRGNYILGQLPAEIPFEITTNGGADFSVTTPTVTLTGNAWYRVGDMFLAGRAAPLEPAWLDADTWQVVVPLEFGANTLTFQGYGCDGSLLSTDSITVTTTSGQPVQDALRVSEMMYNPPRATAAELVIDPTFTDDDFEFIELVNTGPSVIDLAGVRIAGGIDFDFTGSAVTSLGPGEHVVVAESLPGFAARYSWTPIRVAGQYDGRLGNGGDQIILRDALGQTILDFTYDDNGPGWHATTDGPGYSLVIVDPHTATANWNLAAGWRPSHELLGSPGEEDLISGDANADDQVSLLDLAILQANFATASGATRQTGDLNRDGMVSRADVEILARNFGRFYTPPATPPPSPSAAVVAVADGPKRSQRLIAATRNAVRVESSSSLLKKGTGSERPVKFTKDYAPSRGACPLFQQAASQPVAIQPRLGVHPPDYGSTTLRAARIHRSRAPSQAAIVDTVFSAFE